jgi:hypothetical protein
MHGRGTFQFSDEQRRRLRVHLERGGFLFANSICSAEAFTSAFQSEMQKMFPNAQLQKIPQSDPIFSDAYGGFNIGTLELRASSRAPGQPRTTASRPVPPELFGIRSADDERWMVVFSPNDVSCALEKASSSECRGYTQQSALKLAANVMMYVIGHDLQ